FIGKETNQFPDVYCHAQPVSSRSVLPKSTPHSSTSTPASTTPHPRLPDRPTHPSQMEDTTMTERNPILITGAGGQVGGVSRVMVDMLLEQGHPARAFVRRDDERAQSLREAEAEVFLGDLLNIADVTAALKGVRRIYFSM